MTDNQPSEDTSANADAPAPETKPSKLPYVLAACLIAIGVFAWWYSTNTDTTSESATQTAEVAPVLDINDVPEVIATVNGEPVSRELFFVNLQQVEMMALQQGLDTTNVSIAGQLQSQALERSLDNELLVQAAKDAGTSVSQDMIDAEMALLREQFPDEEAFQAELTLANMTEAEVEESIMDRILLAEYLTEQVAVVVTEEEISTAYDTIVEQGANNGATLEELAPQIENELTISAQQQIIGDLLSELRTEAEVEILFTL